MNLGWLKNWWVWAIGFVVVIAVIGSFYRAGDSPTDRDFSDVLADARAGKVERIVVRDTRLDVRFRDDPTDYRSRIGSNTDLAMVLQNEGVNIGSDGAMAVHIKYEASQSLVAGLISAAIYAVFLAAPVYIAIRLALGPGRLPKEDQKR